MPRNYDEPDVDDLSLDDAYWDDPHEDGLPIHISLPFYNLEY